MLLRGVAVRGLAMMRSPSPIERRELIADVQERERRRGPMRQLIDLLGARFGPRLRGDGRAIAGIAIANAVWTSRAVRAG